MRNAIIVAHTAIGEPGLLPEDLMEISRAINREYQNLATLISLLETASWSRLFESARLSAGRVCWSTSAWTMTAKECPESGTCRSLKSTLALWAGRIALIAIAVSILSGLSLVMRFFGGH
jgi:hypothetical protein